jgi:hypothetical protein
MSWDKADLETLKEIVRAAEAYLQSQLELAKSADQRGSTMASAFTLAGAALVAGLITLASTPADATEHLMRVPVYVGGVVAALMFLGGAFVCVRATMPVEFWLPGNEPENWRDDVHKERTLKEMLGDQADNYQRHIGKNDGALRRNARWFKWGATLGVAAPFVGCAMWLLASLCRFAS